MAIEWKPSFETGIVEVDTDHRRLVALINELEAILAEGGEAARIGAVIDALMDYADYHFKREEGMMRRFGYAELASHEDAHVQFGQFLGDLVGNCMLNPTLDTARVLQEYLQHWLVDHILTEDMKYVPFLRDRV